MSNDTLGALAREAAALAREAEHANAPAAFVERLRRLHDDIRAATQQDNRTEPHLPRPHRPDHGLRLYRPAEDQPSGTHASCPHCGKKLP